MSMQALIDGLSAQWQRDRAKTQMTLGTMIETLESLPEGAMIDGIAEPHSYRGYYSDLAFEPVAERIAVSEALTMCRSAMGEVFTGYKGGNYQMGKLTPVWLAHYGCTGARIMSIDSHGIIEATEED